MLRTSVRLRALLLVGAASLVTAAPAWAAQGGELRTVALPADALGPALIRLGRTYGQEIVVAAETAEGRRAAPVAGAVTLEQALTILLDGSGLGWRRASTGVLLVEPAVTAQPSSVEEVVVTAQRREEQGQDVPVAVTAFGPQAIEDFRLENLRDVSRLTPGLLVSSFSPSSPTIAVRGANNTFTQIGANKPVAVVVDDVFVPRGSAADVELFGLNSIQVLKGPQGTLFGRNVTGGAILLDTGRPRFERSALRLRATAGDYGRRSLDAVADASGDLSAAFRVAGSWRARDGYGRDRLTQREQDDLESAAVRGQVRLQASPDLELLFGADYADDRSGGRTLSSVGPGDDGDRRTSETGVEQRFDRTQGGMSARAYWRVAGGRLTSISALRQSQSGDVFSNVGANFRLLSGSASQLVTDDSDDIRTVSQELRFESAEHARGRFVLGAYISDDEARRVVSTRAFAAGSGALITDQKSVQAVDSTSYALFADAVLALTRDLSLTLGARQTWDRKRASLVRSDLLRPAADFALSGLEEEWSELTPRAVLTWTPRENLLAYASYARGYTAGGFNTDAATPAALRAPFAPETVENYELGFKSDWLHDRLRLNVALFEMTYEDKQELFFNNLTRILNITNAASATVKGVEVEARLRAAEWLVLGAGYGRLDSRYDDFVIPGGPVYTGNPLGSSPEHKLSLSADLDLPIGRRGWLVGAASYARTSGYFTGASADPNLRVPGYDLVNLSAGYEPPDRRWRLSAFVRNLEDTEYLLTPSIQVVRAEYLGEPRTAGVTLDLRF